MSHLGDLLYAIEQPVGKTRDDVVVLYAAAIADADGVDWERVNLAIMHRWSLSGLQYVKAEAWKRVAARSPDGDA
jgi:hypothetical protein